MRANITEMMGIFVGGLIGGLFLNKMLLQWLCVSNEIAFMTGVVMWTMICGFVGILIARVIQKSKLMLWRKFNERERTYLKSN